VLTALADYVREAFSKAEEHKRTTGVAERLLKSRRLHSGEYEAATLKQIQIRGGTELFFNITGPKCDALEAWMNDVFASATDRPWDVVPTPIPTLPTALADRVVQATVAEFSGRPQAVAGEAPAPVATPGAVPVPGEMPSAMPGAAPPPTMQPPEQQSASPQEIQQFASDLYDQMLTEMFEDAKKRCDRMARKMEDQTVEGGFVDALAQFIKDLAIYPSAILKGPLFIRQKRLAWQNGQVTVQEEVIPSWYVPDPQDFFPGPNARNVNESCMCERVYYDRRSLADMRGVEGWNTEAITAVLAKPETTTGTTDSAEEVTRAGLEDRDAAENAGLPGNTLDGIEFWGSVQGDMLADWGLKGVDDPSKYYEVTCVLIGDTIIRAVLNPHPLGHRPYYVTSFSKNRSSLWGVKSLPEKLVDCQEGTNGAHRNLIDNLAIASGPQVAVDLDSLEANQAPNVHKQWPWKVWPFNGSKTQGRLPIHFFQPQANSAELLNVAEHFEQKADERTLIPRYVTGDESLTGAGATASGLSMLMNAAARGVKRVVGDMDRDVVRPAIQDLFIWNMMNLPDEALKGDAQIVARGRLAMLTREQTQLRRQEFLQMTNNPTDNQIVGIEGRAALLREIAKGLDIPIDDIVPNKEELRRRVEAAQQAQQMMPEPVAAA
jgi:hypothetical protein